MAHSSQLVYNYSVRSDFTGLAIAARTDLYPTVIHAINTEHAMASMNT